MQEIGDRIVKESHVNNMHISELRAENILDAQNSKSAFCIAFQEGKYGMIISSLKFSSKKVKGSTGGPMIIDKSERSRHILTS